MFEQKHSLLLGFLVGHFPIQNWRRGPQLTPRSTSYVPRISTLANISRQECFITRYIGLIWRSQQSEFQNLSVVAGKKIIYTCTNKMTDRKNSWREKLKIWFLVRKNQKQGYFWLLHIFKKILQNNTIKKINQIARFVLQWKKHNFYNLSIFKIKISNK